MPLDLLWSPEHIQWQGLSVLSSSLAISVSHYDAAYSDNTEYDLKPYEIIFKISIAITFQAKTK